MSLVSWLAWGPAIVLWAFFLVSQQVQPTQHWLLDWHAYSAGARDFVNRELYEVPLRSQFRLPVSEFNYPPLAALVAVPLLALPDGLGGTLWVGMNIAAVALTTVLAARLLAVRHAILWGGVAFLAYTTHPWLRLAFLGNNTPMVVLLVIGFGWAYLRGRDAFAGILLGIAIAVKLWPAALLPLLIRERRWQTLTIAIAVPSASVVLALLWLGFDAIGPAVRAMQTTAELEPGNHVFFVSSLREAFHWWPWWGGYAAALALSLVPVKGRVGLGLGVFAGLAAIPNLWRTYVPAMFIAGLIMVHGLTLIRSRYRDPGTGSKAAMGEHVLP